MSTLSMRVTEVVGFEPTDAHKDIGGLANRCFRPLSHTSNQIIIQQVRRQE